MTSYTDIAIPPITYPSSSSHLERKYTTKFQGNNIQEWFTFFGFEPNEQDFFLKEIEVQIVDDLRYIYDDPILLRQIQDFLTPEQYHVFLKAKQKTVILCDEDEEEEASKERKSDEDDDTTVPPLVEPSAAAMLMTEEEPHADDSEFIIPGEPIHSRIAHKPSPPADPVAAVTIEVYHPTVEELAKQNQELLFQLKAQEERYATLEAQYKNTKVELKNYMDQTIYLLKDVRHEKEKAAQLFKELQKLNKEKEMLDGHGNDCMVCRDQIKNIVFIPCMHISICQSCHVECGFKECPICRVDIHDAKVIYW